MIASQAEYAQREGDADPAAVEHALVRIRSESARMGHLVDDLLLLARLDLGRPLDQGPVDVTRLVLDAVTDASRVSPSHQWQLDLPDQSVTVSGDARTLHQAVGNLLANAATHTPPGTTVRARVAHMHNAVEVSVHDDGPGIDPNLLPHVFERFTRAEASRTRSDGAGLGLAIAHGIARSHLGCLTVDSTPGGTSFVLRLPG